MRQVVDTYLRAWMEQDPKLITTIFTDEATYHERVFQEPIRTVAGIRNYWQTKVAKEQANITARLLNLYLAENVAPTTAIAEWEAEFDDLVKGYRKRIREVAILEFDSDRIANLREYWASERAAI